MKHIVLFLIIFSWFNSYAQVATKYRRATLTGAPPYFLNGIVFIEELSDGTFQFRLDENYFTDNGPDVQIFLINNNNFSTPVDTTGALFIVDVGFESGGINHFAGEYTQPLSSGINSILDFNHVVFVCYDRGMLHWGNGSFGPTILGCSNTTSSFTKIACNSYTSPSGKIMTSPGMFNDTIPNAAMCDSIITINLTINTANVSTSVNDTVITASATDAEYQWIDCNDNNREIVGDTNQSYNASTDGDYAVIITQPGCIDTSECVNINTTSVGIDENATSPIRLYPNPTSGNVIIELDRIADIRIDVKDITGKTLLTTYRRNSSQVSLNINDLTPGFYFATVQYNNQQKVIKLLKQ